MNILKGYIEARLFARVKSFVSHHRELGAGKLFQPVFKDTNPIIAWVKLDGIVQEGIQFLSLLFIPDAVLYWQLKDFVLVVNCHLIDNLHA